MIKYSIGGPITSVEDRDSVEKKEEYPALLDQTMIIITCKKCGLQHAIVKDEKRLCCGKYIELKLS